MLSSLLRYDLPFPFLYLSSGRKLHDDVPPMAASRVSKVLLRELDVPVEELFSSFNLTHPVGSASISQVCSLAALRVRRHKNCSSCAIASCGLLIAVTCVRAAIRVAVPLRIRIYIYTKYIISTCLAFRANSGVGQSRQSSTFSGRQRLRGSTVSLLAERITLRVGCR